MGILKKLRYKSGNVVFDFLIFLLLFCAFFIYHKLR